MDTYHIKLDLFINVHDEESLNDLDAVCSKITDSFSAEIRKRLSHLFKEEKNEKKNN